MAKNFNYNAPNTPKDNSYQANSDGVNKELGPKINLPPKPITQAQNGIGNLSNLQNPSAGKNGINNLSHLQKPAPGKKMKKDTGGDSSLYTDWPLTKFSFKVNIGGFDGEVSFQGMDGLGSTIGKMEFRDGNSSKFYKQSRPTLTTFEPVTLKKGMFVGDMKLFNWYKNVSQGALFSDMRDVTIDLCEFSEGKLTSIFKWTLEKAYVTKYTPSGLDGEADSEVAIEEIELTYQSFSMNAGDGLLGSLLGLAGGLLGAVTGALSGSISASVSFP